ncbi:MAG: 4-hydroxy-tetrahydrodipicolinate synthase [Sulfobacillus acidophilus]|uniref:4-hydroxy-tetrahydrodipicolinate synthase n=1 Tax=Sulfobacillus acidophilus TaxID=53633 RepID=A0A2T2WNH6_9FIRM|nr:MAG: 4-hydroxy-tetrahydrodipicolinate synthase [Sulfobacillus acidophilus]
MMNWPHIITALITPYDPLGRVNPEKAAEIALTLWGQGSGGFVVAGSTGEAYALSLDERRALFLQVRAALPADIPVWMGVGTNDTRSSIELTEAASAWGADGMLVVAPYYNRPPNDGLKTHFVEIARHTAKPVMIYDVPGRTGIAVLPEVVVDAHRQAENIAAVKEAAGSVACLTAMHQQLPSDIKLYAGDDALLLPALAVGAYGIVSVVSHVAAPHMTALIEAFHSGHLRQALSWHESLWPVCQLLFAQSNPIPVKWLLNRLGWEVGGVRPPLVMLDDHHFSALWASYERIQSDRSALNAS